MKFNKDLSDYIGLSLLDYDVNYPHKKKSYSRAGINPKTREFSLSFGREVYFLGKK